MGNAIDADLSITHCFEQSALRPRGSPVDFIGQNKVAENRAGIKRKLAARRIENRTAYNITGQQIGRELNPAKLSVNTARQSFAHQRFTNSRNIFQKDVFAGEERDKTKFPDVSFAENDMADVVQQAIGNIIQLRNGLPGMG